MLLDVHNRQDMHAITQYGKARGTALVFKYLPHINQFKNLYVVGDEGGLKKLRSLIQGHMVARGDVKIGGKPIVLNGQDPKDDEIDAYFYKVKAENPEGVMIGMQTMIPHERLRRKGGIVVDFEPGKQVSIDYVGPGFDSRECTRGQAVHESFIVPWNDVMFLKPAGLNQYRIHAIGQEAYQDAVIERKAFLTGVGYQAEDVDEAMPKEPQPMSLFWKRKVIDEIVLPLMKRHDELTKEGFWKFAVIGNLWIDCIFPMEIYSSARSGGRV